jgi:hypothetical protein
MEAGAVLAVVAVVAVVSALSAVVDISALHCSAGDEVEENVGLGTETRIDKTDGSTDGNDVAAMLTELVVGCA